MNLSTIVKTLFVTAFIATPATAGDVAFNLEITVPATNSEAVSIEPPGISIANREWATPGIEQSTVDLLPPQKFDFAAPRQRFRIEYNSGRLWIPAAGQGPQWLDDVAWPLTRQLFGAGCRDASFGRTICQNEFTFGGVTLQR